MVQSFYKIETIFKGEHDDKKLKEKDKLAFTYSLPGFCILLFFKFVPTKFHCLFC